jgi:hypothetical protein
MTEWTAGFDKDTSRASAALKRAEAALANARRAGQKVPDAEALVREARSALDLVRRARAAHNPLLADTLLDAARRKAESAAVQASRR